MTHVITNTVVLPNIHVGSQLTFVCLEETFD